MAYTNSPLVSFTSLSPNNSGQRTHAIDRITPHCFVGQVTVERMAKTFDNPKRKASCQYGIGVDGRVGMYCEEKNRSWCSSSNANDQRSVTIECASDSTAPYAFNETVYNKLIELCVDICRRNGKDSLLWISDKNTALSYNPKANEMVLTVHRWFDTRKSCPGNWLMARMGDLATKVTNILKGDVKPEPTPDPAPQPTPSTVPFKVRVTIKDLNIRTGAGTNYPKTGKTVIPGVYTIVEVQQGQGSKTGWGKLKSGIGWISLDFCKKI